MELGAVLVFLLLVIIIPVALTELGEWSPWLARSLVRRAVRRLPSQHQARYEQEWLAQLEALPSKKYSQLFMAAGYANAASSMRYALLGLPSPRSLRAKRCVDVVGASLLLVLLAPVLLTVALLLWAFHGGPVLWRQQRIGEGGRHFACLKFCTMRVGPEQSELSWLGRFLRRTSLDEIPQLLNIVRGDMGLVGPRPTRGGDSGETPRVRPGLTGLAQVRSVLDPPEALDEREWDIEYEDNVSLRLDLKILWESALAMLRPCPCVLCRRRTRRRRRGKAVRRRF